MAAKDKADTKSFDEIYLESDEEVTSAIEKIKKVKHANVALCLPRNSVLGQSIVNLKLIYKQASAEGKEVALVSADKITRDLAERIGFGTASALSSVAFREVEAAPAPKPKKEKEVEAPAEPTEEPETNEALAQAGFTSQAVADNTSAPKENADTPADESTDSVADTAEDNLDPEPVAVAAAAVPARQGAPMVPSRGNLRFYRQKKRNWWVPLGIAVGLLLIIGGGVLIGVPQATVAISVQAQPLNETIGTSVDTAVTEINVDQKVLPGKVTAHDQVTKVSARTTGKKDLGNKATGTVTIYNEWDSSSHTFAEGTVVKAKNGNQYVLSAAVTVPGASSSVVGGKPVVTPGQKSGPVEAASAGDGYNIAATSFTLPSLPAAQQEKIYATSSNAFTGGTTKIVSVFTQSDYDTLIGNAKTLNTDESIAGLKTAAGESVVIDKAIKTIKQDVATSVAVDAQADSVEATVTSSVSAITFTKADLQSLLEKALANKIPDGQKLVTSGDGVTMDTSQFELLSATDTRLELTSATKAYTVKQFDEKAVRRALIGAKPNEVKDIVTNLLPVNDVTTTVTPNGWPFLPLISSRLNVTYNYAAPK